MVKEGRVGFPRRPNFGTDLSSQFSRVSRITLAQRVFSAYFLRGSDTVPFGLRTAVLVVTYLPEEAERCGPLGGVLPAIPISSLSYTTPPRAGPSQSAAHFDSATPILWVSPQNTHHVVDSRRERGESSLECAELAARYKRDVLVKFRQSTTFRRLWGLCAPARPPPLRISSTKVRHLSSAFV